MPKVLTLLFTICFLQGNASTIDKAYKALYAYDYFKAKKLFYTQLNKNETEAAYGLATIFYRNDNPFHKLDSAYKYIRICNHNFNSLATEKKTKYKLLYTICDSTISALQDSICNKAYLSFLQNVSILSAEKYVSVYYLSKYKEDVLCKRDSLAFTEVKNNAVSASIIVYIKTYPQSCYVQDAFQLLDYTLYREITAAKNDSAYLNYIKQYPSAKYAQQAKEELLTYYVEHKNIAGIYYYIKNIKPSYFAWNTLFSLEVKNYTEKNLHTFLEKYPDYPDKLQLEEEFKYWATILLPIKHKDKYGFADTTGKIYIEFLYDDAEDFNEGFSLVEKNNLYGYINKSGRIKIDFQFNSASSFNHQVAIVQNATGYYLIDHAGKKISAEYDDITDFTENTAIIKKAGMFGAINTNGEEIIKPSYTYLSDFSEDMAAYMQNNKYGFINKQGFLVITPVFEWVSSFKNGQCRVKLNNHLGVINKTGNFIIQPVYDIIDESNKGIYLVVKNNLYGFIDSSGCFLSEIKYVYNPSLKTKDVTNSSFMRLIKTNCKEELQDKNGVKYFSQENLSQIQLNDGDVIAAIKYNKYQFYSLNKTTLPKTIFTKITKDADYWYCKNDKGYTVFNLTLKEKLFTMQADELKLVTDGVFTYTTDDGNGLINNKGTVLLEAYFNEIIPTLLPTIFRVERKEKGAYFNVNTLKFIWQEDGFNTTYIADEE